MTAATTAPRAMNYSQARRLILIAGLLVLAMTAAIMYARRVDTAEVVAILLFMPVFLAFVFWDVKGGVAAAVLASLAYGAVRWPDIEAAGFGFFAGLLFSRSLAFLAFGAIGGWADRQLEQSLEKLELYDQIDDETALYNARFLLQDTDLEMARARRYKTLFSVAVVDVPVGVYEKLGRRKGRALLRETGVQLHEAVRNVDRAVHGRSTTAHRFVVICPETGPEGVRIFADRLADRLARFLAERGADPGTLTGQAYTFPGDDEALAALREDFAKIDATEHETIAARPA